MERPPERESHGFSVKAFRDAEGHYPAGLFLDHLVAFDAAQFRARFRRFCLRQGLPSDPFSFEVLDAEVGVHQIMIPTHQVQGFLYAKTLYIVRGEEKRQAQDRVITIKQVAEARMIHFSRREWRG